MQSVPDKHKRFQKEFTSTQVQDASGRAVGGGPHSMGDSLDARRPEPRRRRVRTGNDVEVDGDDDVWQASLKSGQLSNAGRQHSVGGCLNCTVGCLPGAVAAQGARLGNKDT